MGAAVDYDIVMVGDFRFPGGTSTAAAAEIEAQGRAGYRTGLLQIKGPVLQYPHPIHPEIRALIDDGACDVLDPELPAVARLLIAHHPQLFTYLPSRALSVEARHRLLVVHHPPLDGQGRPFYDWEEIDRNAAEALGGPVAWAPISPIVRAQLAGLRRPPALFGTDWYNVLDPDRWATPGRSFCADRPVIGRHSRPDPLKWPETRDAVLEAYPDDPRLVVRVLGHGAFLDELMMGAIPANWQVLPFEPGASAGFLRGIDFFVYYHHPRWVEAFGRTVIEALASGCVAILPHGFAPLFGDAALYADRRDAPSVVRRLRRDEAAFRAQSARGVAAVRERFGHRAHVERVRALIGPPAAPVRSPRPVRRRRRRVLFVSSNGIGVGHLTRLLAVARRCPPPIEPVFVTMSQAMRVVEDFGFLAEYTPFHTYLGADQNRWNHFVGLELRELIAFYDPAAIVFDGNMPYGGLLAAVRDSGDAWFVWSRRGMWRPGSGGAALAREDAFDAVIEPRDLADALDVGPTTASRARTRRVDPIRLLDTEEMLPAARARAELGLAPDRTAVLLQLGAGNNFDFRAVREQCLRQLGDRPDLDLAAAESPISDDPLDLPDRVRRVRLYPISRYLAAFDFVVSGVGYNSFHEVLLGGCPALFVPNENPIMDDQLARAVHAERRGLGLCLRSRDVYHLRDRLARLLDPAARSAMRERMARLDRTNGAVQAARILEEMVYSRRADRPDRAR
ncbi:MAG TPA: glycosyltransferase [Geminicoccaceae bacterium]|nr:glycosyltransferase [Geminicoccaceae bacterium]